MTFFIRTFGCQMNVNDSEKMRTLLLARGLRPVVTEAQADLVVVNSCAVRQKAQEKIFSYIGQLPPGCRVILAGCVAQAERQGALRGGRIDFLVGPDQLHRLGEIADAVLAGTRGGSALQFSRRWQEVAPVAAARESSVTAFLSIMEGCDNFCSYCIVPFTRGREKYRPLAAILAEAEALGRQGYAELVLLGQNVNAWRDPTAAETFPGLLARLAQASGMRWIRFITSYPGYHDPRLVEVMAGHRSLARHIHFPAQSGSSRMLKAMARTYTRSGYLKIIAAFRRAMPEMAFSSDFIVGFPGEGERDFALTLSLLDRVQYESVFSFLYSPRRHTRASVLDDRVAAGVKKERLRRLQERQAAIQLANNMRLVGQTIEVLVTAPHPRRAGEMVGRTESYRVVNVAGSTPPGTFVRVRVTSAGPHSLRGEELRLSGR